MRIVNITSKKINFKIYNELGECDIGLEPLSSMTIESGVIRDIPQGIQIINENSSEKMLLNETEIV